MDAGKCHRSMYVSKEDEEPSRARAGVFLGILRGEKRNGTKRGDKKKNTATECQREPKREKTVVEKAAEKAPEKNFEKTVKMNQTTTMAAPAGHPVVEVWVQRALDTGVENLRDEFRQLAKYTSPTMTTEAFTKNIAPGVNMASRNRYQDVPCQDYNIVKLKPPSSQDYIHANFVSTSVSLTRFICTQGPLDTTIEDFWHMIVQQAVEQIVMLCKTIEMGKHKCAQYWPLNAGEVKECGKIKVENLSGAKPLERDGEIQTTMLAVTLEGKTIQVRHLQWMDWPDRGVPPCKLTSLELLSAIRGSKVPIVVHCSAGIGRTGTIVAIEYILEKISANEEVPIMPNLVKAIRDQRAFSIQNDLQYLYIHRVMLNYFLEKYKVKYSNILTPENTAKYEKFIANYNVAVGQT